MAKRSKKKKTAKKTSSRKKAAPKRRAASKKKKKATKKKAAPKKKKATKKKAAPKKKKATKKKAAPKKKAAKKKAAPKKKAAKKKAAPKKKAAKKKAAPKKKKATKKKAAPKKKAAKKKAAPQQRAVVAVKKRLAPTVLRVLKAAENALANPDLPAAEAAEIRDRLQSVEEPAAIPRLLGMLGPGDPHDLRSSIIYMLEHFPQREYFTALLDALPGLARRAPGWAFVSLVRIVNTRTGGRNSYAARFENAVREHDRRIRDLVLDTLRRHQHAVERDVAANIDKTLHALAD